MNAQEASLITQQAIVLQASETLKRVFNQIKVAANNQCYSITLFFIHDPSGREYDIRDYESVKYHLIRLGYHIEKHTHSNKLYVSWAHKGESKE